jgi:hypothetical protein
MILLVTYDLKRPGQDYAKLYEAIKSLGAWWHFLESTWLIDSLHSPQAAGNHLVPFIDRNDRLLVIQVQRNYQGWLPKEAWDWINSRSF